MPCPDPSVPKGVFALFIDGDSIDKIAPDGATIIVDPSDKLLVDRALYLMMNGTGGATVKLFFSDPARLEPCRSEEHTSELQSLMRISYAVFCLIKKKQALTTHQHYHLQIQLRSSNPTKTRKQSNTHLNPHKQQTDI